jgi:TPR repeat protein
MGMPATCNFTYLLGQYNCALIDCRSDAIHGDAVAASILSKMYSEGQGVDKNESLAKVWKNYEDKLKKEAAVIIAKAHTDEDFIEICFGNIVNTGHDNNASACEVLAKRGNTKAQMKLAGYYAAGIGVPKSEMDAKQWYMKAAEGGDPEAQYIIAKEFSESLINKNRWYQRAAKQGHILATSKLAEYYTDMTPERAIELYKRIAELPAKKSDGANHSYFSSDFSNSAIINARYKLAQFYLEGRGALQDYTVAANWCKSAAEFGHTEAQIMLANMYENGIGLPQNIILSHAWLNLVASQGYGDAVSDRDRLEKKMSKTQVIKAQEIAKELP